MKISIKHSFNQVNCCIHQHLDGTSIIYRAEYFNFESLKHEFSCRAARTGGGRGRLALFSTQPVCYRVLCLLYTVAHTATAATQAGTSNNADTVRERTILPPKIVNTNKTCVRGEKKLIIRNAKPLKKSILGHGDEQ